MYTTLEKEVLYTFFMMFIFEFNIILKSIYLYALFSVVSATLNKFLKNQKQIIFSLFGGTLLSLLVLLEFINNSIAVLGVLVVCLLCVVLFKPKKLKNLIFIIFVSLAYTLLKWGFSYLLQIILFRIASNITVKILVYYYLLDLILTIILSFIIYVAFRVIYQKKLILDFVYKTQIVIGNKLIFCKMLLDSGNSLVDDKTGFPVVVISKKVLERELGEFINLNKLRKLGYQTLGGYCSNLFILEPDEVVILKGSRRKVFNAVLGVVEKDFKLYDGLLNTQTI